MYATIHTHPSYWGSSASDEDAEEYAQELAAMVAAKFVGIEIEFAPEDGADDDSDQEVRVWMDENWMAAVAAVQDAADIPAF